MEGRTSATGGASSLRLSAVGDLACMRVKTNTDPIMPANIEEDRLIPWFSPSLARRARECNKRKRFTYSS